MCLEVVAKIAISTIHIYYQRFSLSLHCGKISFSFYDTRVCVLVRQLEGNGIQKIKFYQYFFLPLFI
jgi:hypothetical protein